MQSKFNVKCKRLLALLLAAVTVVLLLPMAALSVFAEESDTSEKGITLGTAALQGAQKSSIYYGTYQQSAYIPSTVPESPTEDTVYTDTDGTQFVYLANPKNSQGNYFKIEPVKWRVLSNADGKLFLLSDQNLDVLQYHTGRQATWEQSTMRSWLNSSGQDGFLGRAFSQKELSAVLVTEVDNSNPDRPDYNSNNTNDRFFLLSPTDVDDAAYGFRTYNACKSTNTAYTAAGGKIGGDVNGPGISSSYWLRMCRVGGFTLTSTVLGNGDTNFAIITKTLFAVRPAFNLNASSVLFTSAAKGGKTASFSANGSINTDAGGYKMTLLDESRSSFSAEIRRSGDQTTVSWTGATTGANEYITAMIVNKSGAVTYYGSLKNITADSDASGTVSIDLLGKMSGDDKLYILNEQYNGDCNTDYASAMNAVDVPSNVTFDANGGTGTMDTVTAILGKSYKLPACGFTGTDDKVFRGWSYTADGEEIIESTSITINGETKLYAVWATVDDVLGELVTARRELSEAVDTKADTATVDAALKNLQEAIDALEAVKDQYVAADAALKTELEAAITAAKNDAIASATTLVNNAKAELNEAIDTKADAATVNEAIANLETAITALEAVKDNYVAADTALKGEIEEEINSLKDRIAALESREAKYKVEDGKLYVRYNETEEWTIVGHVQGSDGITPQFRINPETNEWEASYDNGATWSLLGMRVSGVAGADGLTVVAAVVAGVALLSNIALIAYVVIKKKRSS